MNVEEILGRREDHRLEFKSAGVLAGDLESVAREVVGMLNAEGGEIWIGVEDEEDVAVGINPVADPAREKRRLLDYLLETVDPAPLTEEVRIEARPAEADPAVLVVHAQPSQSRGRQPFAYRKKGGWHFLRRVHARNHPMSREEIFRTRVTRSTDEFVQAAIQDLVAARQEFRDSGSEGLWLALTPVRNLRLDLQDPLFDRLANDPLVSGNRHSGWHFARSTHAARPRLAKDSVRWGVWTDTPGSALSWVEVGETGSLRFWVALRRLYRKGEEREIWPLILLEYPISAFRIAREIYRGHLDPEDRVVANVALFGVSGWKLRGGTPGDVSFYDADELRTQSEPDLLWDPEVLDFREIDETPDRCGFRLVRRVYQAYGLPETAIPRQFDRDTGKLLLPE